MKDPIVTHKDGRPIFTARMKISRRPPCVFLLSFVCPMCGKTNQHGGGLARFDEKGDLDINYGHRVSHCPCWDRGYHLKKPDLELIKAGHLIRVEEYSK